MMHRNRSLVLAGVGMTILLAALPAKSQMGLGGGCHSRFYDPATEATIHGVVQGMQNSSYPCRRYGVQVTVEANKKTCDVRLGPAFFLSENTFSLVKGDKVSVTGSQLSYQGTTVLIAREIGKDGKTLTLRDPQGFPAWAGWARGGRNGGPRCSGGRGGPDCERCWR